MDLRSKNKQNAYKATLDAIAMDFNENHIAGDFDEFTASLDMLTSDFTQDGWVTTNGTHVLIGEGGEVEGGPKGVKEYYGGKKGSSAKSESSGKETGKLKWKETPYGFSEAQYKGYTITDNGEGEPMRYSVDIDGDEAVFETLAEAKGAIEEMNA